MSAVTIEYNIVEAHYEIDRLRTELAKSEAQCEMFKEGLRDYAESDWWRQETVGKDLETYLDDAEADYTLDS